MHLWHPEIDPNPKKKNQEKAEEEEDEEADSSLSLDAELPAGHFICREPKGSSALRLFVFTVLLQPRRGDEEPDGLNPEEEEEDCLGSVSIYINVLFAPVDPADPGSGMSSDTQVTSLNNQ